MSTKALAQFQILKLKKIRYIIINRPLFGQDSARSWGAPPSRKPASILNQIPQNLLKKRKCFYVKWGNSNSSLKSISLNISSFIFMIFTKFCSIFAFRNVFFVKESLKNIFKPHWQRIKLAVLKRTSKLIHFKLFKCVNLRNMFVCFSFKVP